jgi:hypothetical protein
VFSSSLTPKLQRARAAAIAETIAHAARAPFYARVFSRAKRTRGVDGKGALASLPLLDKEMAAAHQESLVVDGVRAHAASREAGIVSSATTRQGRPLRILRSPDEGTRITTAQDASVDDRPHSRTLEIYSPRHGVRMDNDPSRVLLPATLHPNTVDVVVDLLRAKPAGAVQSIRTLVAPLSTLKWITVAMEERGIAPSSFAITEIGVTGYPLTRHARAWLSLAWDAPVFDNYSLSEIAGYAWECAQCAHLHWAGARVVAELIDPVSQVTIAPRARATGELVLTTLVPDVLRMPLIRYRTGDVVTVGPRCAATGTHGIVFRGRLLHSLVDDVGGARAAKKTARAARASKDAARAAYRVFSRDLLELGEALPDIAMHPHAIEVLGRVPPADLGVPKIVVDTHARVVRAELRYDPARYVGRAAMVAVQIRERAMQKGAVEAGVRIELVRPGALDVEKMALKL